MTYGWKKLTPEREEELRKQRKKGVSCRELAAKFGVSKAVVYRTLTAGVRERELEAQRRSRFKNGRVLAGRAPDLRFKLTEEQRLEMKELYFRVFDKEGVRWTYKRIAAKYGVNASTVRYSVNERYHSEQVRRINEQRKAELKTNPERVRERNRKARVRYKNRLAKLRKEGVL